MDKDKEMKISKAIKKMLKDDEFNFLWNDFEVNGNKFDCVVQSPNDDVIFIVGHSICDELNEPDSISKKVADAAITKMMKLVGDKITACKIKFAWVNIVPNENDKAIIRFHYDIEIIDDSNDINQNNEPFEYDNRMVDVFNNLIEHALVLGKSLYWHYGIMDMDSHYLMKALNEFTNMYKQLNVMSLMFLAKDVSVNVEKLDELTKWVISIEKEINDNNEQD